jgi:hypothetical protein
MYQIQDGKCYNEGKNQRDNAITVSRLTVARELPLGGFDVGMSGSRTVREPAKGATGHKKYEEQHIGGRTHRIASSRDLRLTPGARSYCRPRRPGFLPTSRITRKLVMT